MRATLYNQLVNVFWTTVGFAPVLLFWVDYYSFNHLMGLGVVSLSTCMIPSSVLQKLQISDKRRCYEKLGVKAAQAFTQQGSFMNSLVKKADPSYRVLPNRAGIKKLVGQMVIFEKFHLVCLVFFFATMAMALGRGEILLAVVILAANLLINVYPLLIQQYNRARLSLFFGNLHGN